MAFNSVRDQNLNFWLEPAFREVYKSVLNSYWFEWDRSGYPGDEHVFFMCFDASLA